MPFGVKNGPSTSQRIINKAFKEYLNQFMKIFLDDLMIYNDMESHLMKLRLCLKNAKNMVFLGLILRFIVSKEGKILDFKEVQAIISMPTPTNP